MNQYSGNFQTIPASVLNVLYSKLGPLDEYIIMRTGENTIGMLVHRIPSGDIIQYTVSRPSASYGNQWYDISESSSYWSYNVYNEMYVYSNVGYGVMDVLPVHQIMLCWGVTGCVCLVFLALVFKGALFKCLRRRS